MADDTWQKGLSLDEALIETLIPEVRAEIERGRALGYDAPIVLLGEPDDSPKARFRRTWKSAVIEFAQKLQRGELFAVGYLAGSTGDLRETLISTDRWRILKPDFKESSAHDAGCSFIGIRVFQALPKAQGPKSTPDPYRTGLAGRPTIKHLIEHQFRREAEAGVVAASLRAQAEHLLNWARETHPTAAPPSVTTIENHVRQLYWSHRGRSRKGNARKSTK